MNEATTQTLPLLPLLGGVVVPGMVITIVPERPEAQAAVRAARGAQERMILVPRVDGRYARVGTIAQIEQVEEGRDGLAVLVRGVQRARIGTGQAGPGDATWVAVDPVTEVIPDVDAAEVRRLAVEYRAVLAEILERRRVPRLGDAIAGIDDPSQLADLAVYSPDLDNAQKVTVLETLDVRHRLETVLAWANESLAELKVRDDVRARAAEEIEGAQRDAILRRQLAAIRAELGESEGDVVAEYRAKLEAAPGLPAEVVAAVEKELGRLERLGENNPEYGWVRSWLDTIFELPWGERSDDHYDLDDARAILDADHTGLDDVKDRLVEFLAVRKLRAERGLGAGGAVRAGAAVGTDAADGADADTAAVPRTQPGRRRSGAILALVGPPGVGKTSLGESVARALGRRFVRVALGGVRDEAEIRGHRRTYVGAQPGRIVRALTEAGTMNPVFLLDEIDKVGSDWRGDPSSALLEVLDPAQNHTFRDHYLEVDLDLSDVVFLATANVIDQIPAPLLDRMELIRLDGYSDDAKVTIATTHLLPRLLRDAGLEDGEVVVTDAAIAGVVADYTAEAGVRSLERRLGKLVRKAATKLASGAAAPIVIDVADVRPALGRPTVDKEVAARVATPGVATGLAVTGAGGDVLFVEASVAPGESGLSLTGQLGDVMKESAEIALHYVRAHAGELGIAEAAAGTGTGRVHLHVPAGAVPKDGPSAGVTMVTALTSLLSGRAVRADVGMTGEVTLHGRVLPIGGVTQKVLAAHRAGLTTVILPQRNADDVDDVPESVRDAMTFHFASTIDDVLAVALVPASASTPDTAAA